MTSNAAWPELPRYAAWRDTHFALRLWLQVVGKYRLARQPWVNHSWHATLYVTPRGLTTGPVADGGRTLSLTFDFIEHQLHVAADTGARVLVPLEAMSVADFHAMTKQAIRAVGGTPAFHHRPDELPDPIPFASDIEPRPYNAPAVRRFHAALLHVNRVFERFRTGFIGKVSPVHVFWGAFDLAVTRFSGRRAPLHPGGAVGLPDEVTREAYSHEVSSAGFWAGGGGVDEAMFYSYAYPEPHGFRDRPVEPAGAYYDASLGEYLMPYAAVQASPDPDATLLQFLQATYEAAATSGHWDRAALECKLGRPLVPRPL